MHELSLATALMRQVEQARCQAGGERVLRVRVSVGAFADVVPELLTSAFRQVTQDTPLAGVLLELLAVPLEAHCASCTQGFRVQRFCFRCPHCQSDRVEIIRGEGLVLESVTVAVSEEVPP